MFKNIVIIHGIGGIEKEPYFPHLKMYCEKLGLRVFMPSLGSYRDDITYNDWSKYFDENILPYLNKETIVVAQSVGTQFIVKYLSQKNIKIGLYISCAGPKDINTLRADAPERSKNFSTSAKTFKPSTEEFENFKRLNFPKHSLFCDNDIFFSQDNLENYSKAIESKPMLIIGKGHFNKDAGVNDLPELEILINEYVTKI